MVGLWELLAESMDSGNMLRGSGLRDFCGECLSGDFSDPLLRL
jgi:hypothetical protein